MNTLHAKARLLLITLLVAMGCWHHAAHAARVLTATQSPSGAGAVFNMGSVQALSFTMTNNNTGGNTGEKYYAVNFTLGTTGTVFDITPVAPVGWYVSSASATSVTFRVTSTSSAISLGQSVVFAMSLKMGVTSADASESFSAVVGYYTNPPKNKRSSNASSNGSWTRQSLAITSFQITNLSGATISAVTSGSSFQLVMTIQNNSSILQTVVSNPNPPTATKTGTVTLTNTGTTGSPLTLAPGASGSITFTYSTAATDNGTLYFTARAQNGPNVTSVTATSNTLVVSSFVASIVVSPTCQYPGSNVTVTMTVTNGSPSFAATSVTPSLAPIAFAPVSLMSGPTPTSIASIGANSSANFTWIYQVTAAGTANPFTFSGSASGTRNGASVPTPPVNLSTSTPPTKRGGFVATASPSGISAINAGSGNVELQFSVTNNGCANISSVAIPIATGWTWANDAYSLVNSATGAIETWTPSGANPVTFATPNPAGQIPLTFSGNFSLVFSATPIAATTSIFNLVVTDSNGIATIVPVSIVVDPFKTGVLNNATNKIWREDFR